MRRTIKQAELGLFDYQDHVAKLSKRETSLDQLNKMINWERFRRAIRGALHKSGLDKGGPPAFDELFMFKILVLQRIHDLSEEATELAIMERLTWHRFLDVHVGSRFPDKNTIWDFKQKLIKHNAFARCFEEFFTQIAEHGVKLESGKIVDATIVEVPVQRNSREENDDIRQGKTPEEWTKQDQQSKLRQKDIDASWTRKHGRRYFGYKNHIKVDQRTKMIESCVVTPANVHDSQVVEDLISSTDGRFYGDGAYHSANISKILKEHEIQDWSIQPKRKNTELSERQRSTNRTKSRIRARVEHIFGAIGMRLGGMRQRCIGFERNAQMLILQNLIYNMDRLRVIS